ncbi:aldo/keto reductase [Actinacidiphila sp. DG2A-62]|uniref:aldo/keto reductase n=1 Tax=Actinacidiphila sp. DG2A-62 TaxID=3108821 RepID=UPI002DBF15A9|nr:aldo/keto reductase [Actinacidiphila sp. DG2A-62]MEC3995275.1 aldo/keto reductase [Actinacidiphila sp. DG2A-62]
MCHPHPRVVLGLHRSRHERRTLTAALDLDVTTIDTSFNYHRFTAHETLTRVAGDLLPRLTISTKVGFFPTGNGQAEHSLDPGRLLQALEKTNTDLGRPPDLVFLHNPERSLERHRDQAAEALATACDALREAATRGLCGAWGIASWDPSRLPELIDTTTPRPDVLMTRTGLTANSAMLDAAETLTAQWKPNARWGMSPFGGNTDDPVWQTFDPRIFLQGPSDDMSRLQAAFRLAYHLPPVTTVAVGTDNPTHLRELLNALPRKVDSTAIHQYRSLLRERARHQPA